MKSLPLCRHLTIIEGPITYTLFVKDMLFAYNFASSKQVPSIIPKLFYRYYNNLLIIVSNMLLYLYSEFWYLIVQTSYLSGSTPIFVYFLRLSQIIVFIALSYIQIVHLKLKYSIYLYFSFSFLFLFFS
jgi:hypothetical protein